MILRGTVLSEKRTPLDGAHPDRATLHAAPASATVVELVPPTTRAPLSLDAVLEWLENQDPATHAALATHLAGDLEEVRLIAEREGNARGEARGLKEARAKTEATVELLAQVAAEAQLTLAQESEQLAAQCADIVMEVLGKIAGPTLGDRAAIVPVVLQVVGRLKDEREMIIRVSERDLPVLQEAQATLSLALSGRKFVLVADSRLELGGCIARRGLREAHGADQPVGRPHGRVDRARGSSRGSLRDPRARQRRAHPG
jgi:flagellar biosynthesis/type III secretory pathway protein FliH